MIKLHILFTSFAIIRKSKNELTCTDCCEEFYTNFKFASKDTSKGETRMSCYFNMVVEKHLKSKTWYFSIVFVSGYELGEQDTLRGRHKEKYTSTAGITISHTL